MDTKSDKTKPENSTPIERKEVGVSLGLSLDEQKKLLSIARMSIEKAVKGEKADVPEVTEPILKEKRGAFVTINKHGELRGCIGYIEAIEPLVNTVWKMAQQAALHDPRFSRVTVDELDSIEIEISVLTPLEKITDVNQIEVGKHGIYIVKGWNRGLLLPQVATDWGWNRTEFLEHTCNKAGLPKNAWKDPNTEIYIFSAQIFHE